jgi:hypothetical protein
MRIQLVVSFALAAVGVSAANGCSSSANPYPDTASYCSAYAKAICQVSSTCQFDPGACQSYQASQCNSAAAQAMSAGRQYNSNNVQSCLNALNAAYGASSVPSVSAATVASYTATCDKVFGGTAGHHAACVVNSDCSTSGDVCASAPGSSSKQCVTPTPKQLGDACADPGDQCPSSAYCQAQTGTSVCVAAATSGQACSATTPCDGSDHCVNGTCSALAGQGQLCGSNADCSQSSGALFCDLYTVPPSAPTPICVNAYTFARGSVDCLGFSGQATVGGGSSSGGSSSGGDAGGSSSGGDAGGSSSGSDAATD